MCGGSGKEIKETIPSTVATHKNKYKNSLTKELKDLQNENLKILRREIKKPSEDGETSHAHGLVRLIL